MSSQKYPSINIVGAGIAGLSLACHLRRRRIPFNIFDAASKPKGHNYGITISPWGYTDLLPALEPKLDARAFREATAVDRLIGGTGIISSSNRSSDDFRAADMALRQVLARGHNVNWNHKVTSAEPDPSGLRLKFENGAQSTAKITIDAGGERAALTSFFLPDLKPEILPYAVYHGNRYIPQSDSHRDLDELFSDHENVTSFSLQPTPSPGWHIQLSKSCITRSQLPSKITLENTSPDDPIIELRYTLSRPSIPPDTQDALFNPTRPRHEASTIPDAFHAEISTYLSQNPHLPDSLGAVLSPSKLRHDRILNWLLRVRILNADSLQSLAGKQVIAVGDAMHSTPPLGSEGASWAMSDAAKVAEWLENRYGSGNGVGTYAGSAEELMECYGEMVPAWADGYGAAGKLVYERIRAMHRYSADENREAGKL